jgi:aminoglycoside phosphotransferase (APT) family kinase protein
MKRMHADELTTDVGLVQRLINSQFPQWSTLPIHPVSSSGTDNALYRLGDDMVVRLPRIHWAVDDEGREHQWLPRLARLLPVAIPVPIARGKPGEEYPWRWSIYPWLEGDNPAIDAVANSDLFAREVAHFVNALHAVDREGAPPASRGVPLAMWDGGRTRDAIDAAREMIDTETAAAAWAAALRLPAWSGSPVWIHGDLMPGNLLVQDGHLTAVIDWGAFGLGDPAVDLMVAWNTFRAVGRNAFRAALEVDEETWARGRAWALSTGLLALPYYRDTNPVLADNARFRIGEVLADFLAAG